MTETKKSKTPAQSARLRAGQLSARIARAELDIAQWKRDLAALTAPQGVLFQATQDKGPANAG